MIPIARLDGDETRLVAEAWAIADGGTMARPTRDHLQALIALIKYQRDDLEGRWIAVEACQMYVRAIDDGGISHADLFRAAEESARAVVARFGRGDR